MSHSPKEAALGGVAAGRITRHSLAGLDLAVCPAPGMGVVSLRLSLAAGAGCDPDGLAGLAHLCGHLFFEGHSHFVREMEWLGGTADCSVTLDGTDLCIDLPAASLTPALQLLGERFASLPDGGRKERFAAMRAIALRMSRERNVVADEGLSNVLRRKLYPESHPYAAPILGRPDEIASLRFEDARRFFLSHYTRRNLQITLVGDFSEEPVLEQIAAWNLPVGPTPLPTAAPVALKPVRGHLPLVAERGTTLISWRGEADGSETARCYEMLATWLTSTRRDAAALGLKDLDVQHVGLRHAGELRVLFQHEKDLDMSEVEGRVRQWLGALLARDPTQEERDAALAAREFALADSLSTSSGVCAAISRGMRLGLEPGWFRSLPGQWRELDACGIGDVLLAIAAEPAVIVSTSVEPGAPEIEESTGSACAAGPACEVKPRVPADALPISYGRIGKLPLLVATRPTCGLVHVDALLDLEDHADDVLELSRIISHSSVVPPRFRFVCDPLGDGLALRLTCLPDDTTAALRWFAQWLQDPEFAGKTPGAVRVESKDWRGQRALNDLLFPGATAAGGETRPAVSHARLRQVLSESPLGFTAFGPVDSHLLAETLAVCAERRPFARPPALLPLPSFASDSLRCDLRQIGPQATLLLGMRIGPPAGARSPDALILEALLAGGCGGIVDERLRRPDGRSHDFRARVVWGRPEGVLQLAAQVPSTRAEAVEQGLRDLLYELTVQTSELEHRFETVRNSLVQALPRVGAKPRFALTRMREQLLYGLPDDHWQRFPERLLAVDCERFSDSVERWIADGAVKTVLC